MQNYDVVVIGGGTAGSNAAREAGKHDKKVLLIHTPELLNLCIEEGCMPSKSLLSSAEVAEALRSADAFGIEATKATIHFQKILERRREHVQRFKAALLKKIQTDPYEVMEGYASFLPDDGGVEVKHTNGSTTVVYGQRYVIATGTKQFIPPIEGLESTPYLTSEDIMHDVLTTLPESVTILGGGAIGLEFATFFAALGSSVTILERGPLVPHMDPEFQQETVRYLTDSGIRVYTDSSVDSVQQSEVGVTVVFTHDAKREECTSQVLFLATGRIPNLDSLRVEAVGIALERGSFVSCTERGCAENDRVYAAGDVTRDLQLLHIAEAEGKAAGYNAAFGVHEKQVDHAAQNLGVIFTHLPIASVGKTETQVKESGVEYVAHTIRFPETGRSIIMGVEHGMWKLLVDRKTGHILGSQLLGPRGDDLIHQVYLLMCLGVDIRNLDGWIAYHPTLSEQFAKLLREVTAQLE